MAILMVPIWKVGEYKVVWWLDPNRYRVMIWHMPTHTLHRSMWSKDMQRLQFRVAKWIAELEADDE